MDKLRAMTSFVRIVDKGSLTAAAADLDVSLPSMVRTLAALERELGATLLNRTTRRIHLTDEGRQYLEQCRAILAQVQQAEAGAAFAPRRAARQAGGDRLGALRPQLRRADHERVPAAPSRGRPPSCCSSTGW